MAAPAVRRPTRSEEDRRAIESMVLFEDRDLMVLNKPYGLAVQGGSGTKYHLDGMLAALGSDDGNRPLLVHRLDRDTSGVLLVARTRKVAAELGEIFRSRQARKIYWALVQGVPRPAQGRISLFLAKGEAMGESRGAGIGKTERAAAERMRVAKHGDENAQHSITLFATVDRVLPRLAWLSMKPITGARINCALMPKPSATRSSATRNTAFRPRHKSSTRRAPYRPTSSRNFIFWHAG